MKRSYGKCPKCGADCRLDKAALGKAAKRHGGAFETRVCKRLEKLTGLRFSRGAGSIIDIISLDVTLPFTIECKSRESITLAKAMYNSNILKWVDGKEGVTENQVIIFNDGGKIFVAFNKNKEGIFAIGIQGYVCLPDMTIITLEDFARFVKEYKNGKR